MLTEAVERGLDDIEHTTVDANVRVQAHHALAQYYMQEGGGVDCEAVVRHCRAGLFLLKGKERVLPRMVGELNVWCVQMLLRMKEEGFEGKMEMHAREGQVALYWAQDLELEAEMALALGEMYAASGEEPVCERMMLAVENYTKALNILSMREMLGDDKWVELEMMQVEVLLRFVRHRRRVRAGRGGACVRNEFVACRKRQDYAVDDVVKRAEDLRRRVTHAFQGTGREAETTSWRKKVMSKLSEDVGRAYLERAEEGARGKGRVKDLKKGVSMMCRALKECESEGDFMGSRAGMLREWIEEVEGRIEVEEREVVEGGEEAGDEDEWEGEEEVEFEALMNEHENEHCE
eukprot:GFKZ01013636.1.p1 GENE.GFKZ01013636.1~~GFKZ01013636.1.p1  ORF type:complete len:348 (-),score=92.53 GFKZ01013636.1:244-1287(-)